MRRQVRDSALRIAGLYAGISAVWIVLSDRVAGALAKDLVGLELFQTLKGLFFVGATALALFLYARNQMKALVAAQLKRERDALAALAEREELVREIHHRVKNNLQVIVSLMNLGGEGDRESLKDKVRSMALVHEFLYQAQDLRAIEAKSFIEACIRSSALTPGLGSVEVEADELELSIEQAVPLGLFLSEAMENARRHAGSGARARVSLRRGPAEATLEIRDDGAGFGGADPAGLGGTGFALMRALAEQAKGSLFARDEGGAIVGYRFPLDAG